MMNSKSPAHESAHSCISAKKPLIFMHIPKTGGMSIFTAFTTFWGTDIADFYNISSRNLPEAKKLMDDSSKALYCGHYSFGMHEWLTRPAYYAAVLREPVSRIVSLYYYCQPMLKTYRLRLEQAGGSMKRLANQQNISDFYLDFEPWLAGEPNAESFFASPCAELDNGMVRRFSGYGLDPRPCPQSALELAKQNIDNSFSVVGLLERYPETLQLISDTFSLPVLNENRVNANPSKGKTEKLSDEIMHKIREMNLLDLKLYEWVKERFDARISDPKPAIALPGGGRSDMPSMPLWRSVGYSPMREAAMQQRGVPKIKAKVDGSRLICRRVRTVGLNSKSIWAELELMQGTPGDLKSSIKRLVLDPRDAKILADALNQSLDAYEKKHVKRS